MIKIISVLAIFSLFVYGALYFVKNHLTNNTFKIFFITIGCIATAAAILSVITFLF